MSELSNAAAAIRNTAQLYKALSDASDVLDTLGSLDNAASEAQARLTEAVANRDAVANEADDLRASMVNIQTTIDGKLGEANSQVQEILDGATARAKGVLSDAQHRSEAIVSAAKMQATAISADSASILSQQQEMLAGIAQLRSSAQDVRNEITTATAQLAAIKDQIAKITGAAL